MTDKPYCVTFIFALTATLVVLLIGVAAVSPRIAHAAEGNVQSMYRLYNPNSGEHFYTASTSERDELKRVGWSYEGIGWNAPKTSSTPVYRLYSGTDHHYTTSVAEKNNLVRVGWRYEGVGWYSDDNKGQALYRQFNPNVNPKAKYNNSGSHNYTTSTWERDYLIQYGWRNEGIGWYGHKHTYKTVHHEAATGEVATYRAGYDYGQCNMCKTIFWDQYDEKNDTYIKKESGSPVQISLAGETLDDHLKTGALVDEGPVIQKNGKLIHDPDHLEDPTYWDLSSPYIYLSSEKQSIHTRAWSKDKQKYVCISGSWGMWGVALNELTGYTQMTIQEAYDEKICTTCGQSENTCSSGKHHWKVLRKTICGNTSYHYKTNPVHPCHTLIYKKCSVCGETNSTCSVCGKEVNLSFYNE